MFTGHPLLVINCPRKDRD